MEDSPIVMCHTLVTLRSSGFVHLYRSCISFSPEHVAYISPGSKSNPNKSATPLKSPLSRGGRADAFS